jgi:hypothetical protein
MTKVSILFTVALLLVGMVMSPPLALGLTDLDDINALGLPREGIVTIVRSVCYWGLYVDDNGSGVGPWDSLLFISNPSATPQNFDVIFVTQGTQINTELINVAPNELRSLNCEQMRACNSQGWLLVQSDARIFGGTLLLSNSQFGGGSLTTQAPSCGFFLQ